MLKSIILLSDEDPVGKNLMDYYLSRCNLKVIEKGTFYLLEGDIGIYYLNESLLEIDKPPEKAEFYVFGSRHESAKKTPSFLVHVPGNWDKAEHGGKDYTVSIAAPWAMKAALVYFHKNNSPGYYVGYEATHHGPSLDVPCAFIEVGSTPAEWNNKPAIEILAKACIIAAKSEKKRYKTVIGIGGPHYPIEFTKIALMFPEIAFGHIIPRYHISEKTIIEAMKKSPDVRYVIFESRKHKRKYIKIISEYNNNIDIYTVREFYDRKS